MLTALQPYASAIKIGLQVAIVVAIFTLGSWAGCSVGKGQSADTIKDLNKQITTLTLQVDADAKAVAEANAQVQANKQFAKEREKMAEDAAKDAAKAKRELDAQGRAFQKKLKDAEKDPDCKAILEMNLCPLLRDY